MFDAQKQPFSKQYLHLIRQPINLQMQLIHGPKDSVKVKEKTVQERIKMCSLAVDSLTEPIKKLSDYRLQLQT